MLRVFIIFAALSLGAAGGAAGPASQVRPAAAPASAAQPAGLQPWADWHEQMLQRALRNPAAELRVSMQRYNAARQAGDLRNLRRLMVEIDTLGAETSDALAAYTREEFKAQIRLARAEGDKESLFDLLTNDVRNEEYVYKPVDADLMLDEAEEIARTLASQPRLAQVHFERGWRHYYMDRRAEATREFNAALALADRPIEVVQVLLSQLAVVQATTQARASVEEIAGRIQQTIPIADYPVVGLVVATDLGDALHSDGNLDGARQQYLLARHYAQQASGLRNAAATLGLADIHIKRGEIGETQRLLDSRDWQSENSFMQFRALTTRIEMLAARKDPRALALLPQAEKLLSAYSDNRQAQRRFHQAQAAALSAAGRYREALAATRAMASDTEAVYRTNNEALRLDLQIRHEVNAKDRENELLQATTALLQQRRDALAISLFAAISFLLVVGMLLLLQLRQKRRLALVSRELAQANHDLKQLHSARTRLLAAACHDLRQPAHALGLLAEMTDATDDPVERQNKILSIKRCSSTLTDMLSMLMDMTQLEGGHYHPQLQPVPLSELLGEVELQFSAAALQKGLSLLLPATDKHVLSDKHLLRRIVFNLVANAVKYTRAGAVTLRVAQEGGDIVLSVQDTGPGIAAEKLSQVFVEHVRLDTEYAPEGLGLGLPIVRRACSLLQHEVRLQSQAGSGTTALLRMRAAQPAQPANRRRAEKLIGAGKSVVVVEDDPEARAALQGVLRRWGFTVIDAPSGTALWASAAGQSMPVPDLLISDLHLGQESGLHWIREFRRRTARPDLPALLLTGDLDQDIAASAAAEGVKLAHKPLLPARLHATLTAMLPRPAPSA